MNPMDRDPLEELTEGLARMDVRPDHNRRDRTMALAREKFDVAFQENAAEERPIPDPPRTGAGRASLTGAVISMTRKMKKSLLYGTSGLVMAGLATVVTVQLGDEVMNVPQNHAKHESLAEVDGARAPQPSIGGDINPVPQNKPPISRDFESGPSFGAVGQKTAPASRSANEGALLMAPVQDRPTNVQGQNRDRFPDAEQNPVNSVAQSPISTFSIDVDTASYSTTRRWLNQGRVPEASTVRVEEMINYFDYDWPAPEAGGAPFRASVANYETPWNAGTEIVRIGLQGMMPDIDARPPLDLVFLIDTSGSMRSPDKLGLLKQSFLMMLGELRPEDRVSIVTYAGSAGTTLELTPASDRATIRNALENLSAGGSTAGAAGLREAYGKFDGDDDRVGRVILATDGDFNVGMSGPDAMTDFIADQRETGAYLSVLGFGQGNYNDTLMQALAQNGNGQAAYIDTLSEARKVLVDQLTGNLFTIAEDVKIQVEFNPAVISEYRLIGYETRALAREDFSNDKVDAGEIGAGHQVTALYEVTPVGSDAARMAPVRYDNFSSERRAMNLEMAGELGFLRLRYKAPGEDESRLIEAPISKEQEAMTDDDRFALAIAGFGQHLRGGKYLEDWGMDAAVDLARDGRGEDPFGYRSEALQLMQTYEALSR